MTPVKKLTSENCKEFHSHWEEMGWPIESLCICPKPEKELPIRLTVYTGIRRISIPKEETA